MAGNGNPATRRSFLKAAGGATVAATATGSIAGCLGGDGDGTTLSYGRSSHSNTLDPQNTTSGEVAKVTNQIYNGLIDFQPGEVALTESLATDWTMEGETVTLTLREGVTFHDGTEFTADDFIATYRRFVDEEYEYYFEDASAYGPFTFGSWIDDVSKDGDYGLNITLTQSYAPFLRNLAMFAAVVLSQDDIESEFDFDGDANGTGPFELDTLDDDNERIRLTAYGDYWGDGPSVDQVVFHTRGQNSTRGQALVDGDFDIVDNLDPSTIGLVEDGDGTEIASADGINLGYMAFNLSRVEAFRDRRVRQAISYAIDTESIVEDVYAGIAEQADQPIPPTLFGHNDDLSPYAYDPEEAQSLLDETDYSDGLEFELTTFQNARGYNPAPIQTAETIRTNLGEIGIDVTIDDRTFSDYLEYTTAGNHDATLAGWYTDNADPDNFCYALLHPQVESPDGQDWVDWGTEDFNTSNNAAWANQEYMDLVEQAQQTIDQDERIEIYNQAVEIAHEEAPWVYIDYAQEIRGVSTGLSNYDVSAIGGPHLHLVEVE